MSEVGDFRVSRERLDDDVVVVACEGEIDLLTADDVQREAVAAAGEGRVVVLDLREVSFMDSSGLRVLVELQRGADRDGTSLAVVPGSDELRRLFDLSGMTSRLTLLADPSDARA